MAKEPSRIETYETWLRGFVRDAESGRKLAAELRQAFAAKGQKLHEQRFASHAQRLYNEEVYWTLQIDGVAKAAAAERAAADPPPKAPARRTARAKPAAR